MPGKSNGNKLSDTFYFNFIITLVEYSFNYFIADEYLYTFNKSGWMEAETFCLNLEKIAKWCKAKKVTFPIIYIVDGCTSHIAFQSMEMAAKLDILLIPLLLNTTRIIQMADKIIFHPIKSKWRELMTNFRRKNPKEELSTENFALMLKMANDAAITTELIQKGFKATGWYSFSKDAVDCSMCIGESAPEVEEETVDQKIAVMQQMLKDMGLQLKEVQEIRNKEKVEDLYRRVIALQQEINKLRDNQAAEEHFPSLSNILKVPTAPTKKQQKKLPVECLRSLLVQPAKQSLLRGKKKPNK